MERETDRERERERDRQRERERDRERKKEREGAICLHSCLRLEAILLPRVFILSARSSRPSYSYKFSYSNKILRTSFFTTEKKIMWNRQFKRERSMCSRHHAYASSDIGLMVLLVLIKKRENRFMVAFSASFPITNIICIPQNMLIFSEFTCLLRNRDNSFSAITISSFAL